MQIRRLTFAEARQRAGELAELLIDAVESGASIGYLAPLSPEAGQAFWDRVIHDMEEGHRSLIVGEVHGRIEGAVQLNLATMPNAAHRAEVMKLMVHSRARRQGIARWLMAGIEEIARMEGRTLLVLDTRQGDAAEKLYESLGWIRVGTIPGYAVGSDGALHSTVFFYRVIPPLVTVFD